MIDWTGIDSVVLLNPRLPAEHDRPLRRLVAKAPELPGHVWLAASGSSGVVRMVALSRSAMLSSAAAVNAHVAAAADDRWLCVLPTFHVGGLAIHARAHLSGSEVITSEWSAESFVQTCARERITLSSLVPAQVSDLVRAGLESPDHLRAVFIGGGRLAAELFLEARDLGWNLLPSFGMTECCSQIATASMNDLCQPAPPLLLLPHLQVRAGSDGRLEFSGTSLLTGYSFEREGTVVFEDPKQDGWFVSEDIGRFAHSDGRTVLEIEGRASDFLKIGGESTSMARLDAVLSDVLRALSPSFDAALIALPDERLGQVIHMAAVDQEKAEKLRRRFNELVLPFERIRQTHIVASIPRSSLGKVLRMELVKLVSSLSPPGLRPEQ